MTYSHIYIDDWTGSPSSFLNSSDWTRLINWIQNKPDSQAPPSSLQEASDYNHICIKNWNYPPATFTNITINPDWAKFLNWINQTPNNKAPQTLKVYVLNNTSISSDVAEVNKYIDEITPILDNLIISSPRTYNIYVKTAILDIGVLGSASWETGNITLNVSYLTGQKNFLNDQELEFGSVVLIHEILHVFGIVPLDPDNNNDVIFDNDGDGKADTTHIRRWFTGSNAVAGYQDLLRKNKNNKLLNWINNPQDIGKIPLENNFGSGTVNVHFEEGWDNSQRTTVTETINNVEISYPVLENEIMTGFLDNKNFLTSMTAGILQDLGLTINTSSTHIMNTSSDMSFIF